MRVVGETQIRAGQADRFRHRSLMPVPSLSRCVSRCLPKALPEPVEGHQSKAPPQPVEGHQSKAPPQPVEGHQSKAPPELVEGHLSKALPELVEGHRTSTLTIRPPLLHMPLDLASCPQVYPLISDRML
jgi:hypothetical protein